MVQREKKHDVPPLPKIDWNRRNALIRASHTIGFGFDFFSHIAKISESFSLSMQKLSPLAIWNIDQLKDKGSTGNNTRTTGKKIYANEILQYR